MTAIHPQVARFACACIEVDGVANTAHPFDEPTRRHPLCAW